MIKFHTFSRVVSNRSDIVFLIIYLVSLVFTTLVPSLTDSLFIEPLLIPILNWIRSFFALLLVTFLPGWALLKTFDKNRSIPSVLSFPLSFIISVFFVFFSGYSLLSLGFEVSDYGSITVLLFNIFILCFWLLSLLFKRETSKELPNSTLKLPYFKLVIVIAVIITFTSTFLLYGFNIVGDQRFHHGLALLYSKSFPVIENTIVPQYPYFFNIFLTVFFVLSGLPTMVAYSLLNILMIIPIIFYYLMVVSLLGKKYSYAPAVATLFAFTASGFGWVYFVLTQSNYSLVNEAIYASWQRTYDILTPNSFFFAANPDVTSPLHLFALPAIFLIVTFLSVSNKLIPSKVKSLIIALLTAFAFLSHPETAIVILIILIVGVLFYKNSLLSVAVTSGLGLVLLLDLFAPGRLYTIYPNFELFGITVSLFQITFGLGILSIFISYLRGSRLSGKLKQCFVTVKQWTKKKSRLLLLSGAGLFAYLYFLSFVILIFVLPTFLVYHVFVSGVVPWYFYPMRLGVVGFLGVIGIFLLLKENGANKYTSISLIWAVLVILGGFSYSEFRMNKHLQLILSIFAGLTVAKIVYRLTTSNKSVSCSPVRIKKRPKFPKIPSYLKCAPKKLWVIFLIGLIFLGSIGSSALYFIYKWNEVRGIEPSYSSSTVNFLPMTEAEIQALEWLKNNVNPFRETVLTIPRGPANQFSEVNQLAGMWIARNLPQHFPFFEINRSDTFMILAQEANLKYIYLNQEDEEELQSNHPDTFIARLVPYLPVAFENSEVTIYEYVSVVVPDVDSDFVVVSSNTSETHETFRTDYAQAPINLEGNVQVTTSSFYIDNLSSVTISVTENNDVTDYVLDELDNGSCRTETIGNVTWRITSSIVNISSLAAGPYTSFSIPSTFSVLLVGSGLGELVIKQGDVESKIQVNESTIITFELQQNGSADEKQATFTAYQPVLSNEGTTFFNSAQFRYKADLVSIIVDDNPLLINGTVSFEISWSDEVLLINELQISGETIVLSDSDQWDPNALNWEQVLLSPYHFLLVGFLSISVYVYIKKPFTNFRKRLFESYVLHQHN